MTELQIKIETDMAIPARQHGRKSKYPLNEMEIGHSFYADNAVSTRQSVIYFQKKNPTKKFTVRKDGGGVRVWRIA